MKATLCLLLLALAASPAPTDDEEHRDRWRLLQAGTMASRFNALHAGFDVNSDYAMTLAVGPTSRVYRFFPGPDWHIDRYAARGEWASITWAIGLREVADDASRIMLEELGWRLEPQTCKGLREATEALFAYVNEAGRSLEALTLSDIARDFPFPNRITVDGPSYEFRLRVQGAVINLQLAEFLGTDGIELADHFVTIARACVDPDAPHWIEHREYQFESYDRWRERGRFPAFEGRN